MQVLLREIDPCMAKRFVCHKLVEARPEYDILRHGQTSHFSGRARIDPAPVVMPYTPSKNVRRNNYDGWCRWIPPKKVFR
jgi:hypothetical protein